MAGTVVEARYRTLATGAQLALYDLLVERLEGAPLTAAAEGLGPGRIDGLRRTREGGYEIRGAFGEIAIRSDRPLLRLKVSNP